MAGSAREIPGAAQAEGAVVKPCPNCGFFLVKAHYKNIPIYVCKNVGCMGAFTVQQIEGAPDEHKDDKGDCFDLP